VGGAKMVQVRRQKISKGAAAPLPHFPLLWAARRKMALKVNV